MSAGLRHGGPWLGGMLSRDEVAGKPPCNRSRAYLLLEVVVALGLLVLGLATIGTQIQSSYDTAVDTHRMLRVMHLAESKLAELEAGLIMNLDSAVENDLEEEFGRLFPSFGWRLRIEPTQTPDLWMVQLQILYQQRHNVEDEEFDFDEAEILQTLRTLRATPATVNLADFIPGIPGGSGADDGLGGALGGLTPEQEEQLQCVLEVLNQYDIDPLNVDLADLGRKPTEELLGIFGDLLGCGVMPSTAVIPPDMLSSLEALMGGDLGDLGEIEGSGEVQ